MHSETKKTWYSRFAIISKTKIMIVSEDETSLSIKTRSDEGLVVRLDDVAVVMLSGWLLHKMNLKRPR